MSLGEKVYLATILFMFVGFMVLMAVLSWLDAKDEWIRKARASQAAAKKGGAISGSAPAHR